MGVDGRKVIVLGAGLAGLAAARALSAAGAAVSVVEARDRPGGRVWTVRDGFAEGQHGDLGGEFIDEDHGTIRSLAAALGLELVPVLPAGFTHRFRSAGGEPRVARAAPWRAFRALFDPLVRRYQAAGGAPDHPDVRELAAWSVRDWLQRQQAGPELHAMADALRGFFLADAHQLSCLALVSQLAAGEPPSQTTMYRVAGGAGRLVEALAAAGGARFLFGRRVRELHHDDERVVVRVQDRNDRLHSLEADAAVVALPASTLRDVPIEPALPEAQQRAIARLRYGCATKAVVECAGDGLSRRRAQAFGTDDDLGAFWDSTAGQSGPRAMLTFMAGGSASAPLRARAEAGTLLEPLCWLGLRPDDAMAARWVSWEDDPLARGGYAFIDPAYDPAWLPLLAQRAGRLVFAGEHTSIDWQGYMEGAVESGSRAAASLIRSA